MNIRQWEVPGDLTPALYPECLSIHYEQRIQHEFQVAWQQNLKTAELRQCQNEGY